MNFKPSYIPVGNGSSTELEEYDLYDGGKVAAKTLARGLWEERRVFEDDGRRR